MKLYIIIAIAIPSKTLVNKTNVQHHNCFYTISHRTASVCTHLLFYKTELHYSALLSTPAAQHKECNIKAISIHSI